MPAKLQQSSKKTTSNIIAPNPAGFLDCFLVGHALRAVCLHPALEAKKKSPVCRRNLPPATASTKLLYHRSSGSPLIVTSVVPGTQELDPSDSDSPVVLLSKFGGEFLCAQPIPGPQLLVQRGGMLPPSMHHLETIEKAGRMKRYKVASSRLATLLWFCRRPEQSAVNPLAEGEEGDAEELW
ncbi:hypothetical protein NDU88_005305 [Pleurodeles waltl]|uniref:Uncharacterized protein n=1 Tax=Pleurodeles waltl TaxID=8319 RepID=A0AAV7ME85_PLEWA|nr:hypothetical protein NDU88_005305 [Pleurodeles waltl]